LSIVRLLTESVRVKKIKRAASIKPCNPIRTLY